MKQIRRIKQILALPLLTAVTPAVVNAHPGHIADPSAHGLLHAEHIIVLVAAGVVALAVSVLRNKR